MVNPGEETTASPDGEQAALLSEQVPMVEVQPAKAADADGQDAEAGSSGSTERKPAPPGDDFVGLTKEELEKFAKDPFWKRLRLILFLLFWIVWFGMLAAVIAIIVISPKCPPRPERYFWQKPFYRVQVRSFAPTSMDSDDAAKLGTVAGLRSKLSYLSGQLGVDNYLLDSLVARSATSGCPVDFAAINANLSSDQELVELTKLGRKKGYSFVMEFDASQADASWRDGGDSFWTEQPKSMAFSLDGKPAFLGGQLRSPRSTCSSLNVTSPNVVRRLRSAMTKWLDAGLSGFVLTNVAYLAPGTGGVATGRLGSLFSNASVQFVAGMRQFLDAEAERLGRDLALLVDAGNTGTERPQLAQLRRYVREAGADAVLDTRLGQPLDASGARPADAKPEQLADVVRSAGANELLASNWPYLLRRPDAALTALTLTLPGVPALYYGQELGMAHVPGVKFVKNDANPSYLAGNLSTDASQTPMQWSVGATSAGWLPNGTQALAWAPLLFKRRDDIQRQNLLTLSSSGHPAAALQLVQQLLKQRSSVESLQWGSLSVLAARGGLLAFARKAERFPSAVVVLNVGNAARTLSLPAAYGDGKLLLAHSWAGAGHAYKAGEVYGLASVFVPRTTLLLFLAGDAD